MCIVAESAKAATLKEIFRVCMNGTPILFPPLYLTKISVMFFVQYLILRTTRYVDGMPTSEVTLVTFRYIRPPNHGHTSQYHGH